MYSIYVYIYSVSIFKHDVAICIPVTSYCVSVSVYVVFVNVCTRYIVIGCVILSYRRFSYFENIMISCKCMRKHILSIVGMSVNSLL